LSLLEKKTIKSLEDLVKFCFKIKHFDGTIGLNEFKFWFHWIKGTKLQERIFKCLFVNLGMLGIRQMEEKVGLELEMQDNQDLYMRKKIDIRVDADFETKT